MSDARRADFVARSEALAAVSPAAGHAGALAEALHLGRAGEPAALAAWSAALGLTPTPELAGASAWLSERFAEQLGRAWLARGLDAGPTVEALAEVLERVRSIDGRLGRLACAWAAELCARPFFVLDAELQGGALRRALAAKLREAVYDLQGRRAERVAGDSGSARYAVAGSPGELIVEWHELQAAEAQWDD